MNKAKACLLLICVVSISGCATTDYKMMSEGAGVPVSTLEENCKKITCSYDNLKDRVQARASDINILFALNGNESRTIQYTWVSGANTVSIELFSVALYGTWSFIDSAEIYVKKEMVARVSSSTDRITGTYNKVANEVEKVEVVRGEISVEAARKIAEAPYESITIRFYGKNGYTDSPLPRSHSLLNVVKIAESMM